jgi:hypothetical protein
MIDDDNETLRGLYKGLKNFARERGGNELRERYGAKPDVGPVQGAHDGLEGGDMTGEGEGGLEPGRAEEEAAIAAMLAEGA